ncbi:MAG: MarR family transcriptional regulator [Deltaproteobacteria bacterium]|nr:MAG: MarR family transcriptional regulator [Deltaproteobacteria bacterium]
MGRPPSRKDFDEASGTLDERLQGALAKLSLAARHDFRRQATGEGLSAVQAQVLTVLARDGAMEMGQLASRLSLTPATVSDSVAALERRGLLRREPVPSDRRRVRVKPTVRGKQLGESLASWPEIFQQGIEDLSPEEKALLLRVMMRMILSFLAKGVIQEARMCVTCTYFRPHVHEDAERPHHCALVDLPLGLDSVRLDCPDHEQQVSPSEALDRLDRWFEAGSPP